MSDEQESSRQAWVLAALEQFEGRLLRYAQRLTDGEVNQARDVVQHAFLRLCDQEPRALDGRLAAWLFTVCRHRAIDLRRKANRSEPLSVEHGAEGPSREADPAEAAETRDSGEQVRRAIATLPTNQQEVVNLWAEGFSYREISQITDRSEGYVRVLVHRAFHTLRRHPLIERLVNADETNDRLPEGQPVDRAFPIGRSER